MSEPLQAASKICARALLVEGPKASGKTSHLIDRLFELLSAGIRPQDIVLIAATPDAARALEERIAARTLSEGEGRPRKFSRRGSSACRSWQPPKRGSSSAASPGFSSPSRRRCTSKTSKPWE